MPRSLTNQPYRDALVVGVALLASVALVLVASGNGLVALSFGGGLALLGLIAFTGARYRPGVHAASEGAEIDWSVTRTALEQAGLVAAITDRANRLVCATRAYEEHFATAAPPRLVLDEDATDLLTRLARTAWREGKAAPDMVVAGPDGRWLAEAHRAGLAEDLLVWRFTPLEHGEAGATGGQEAAQQISGDGGALLSRAGIAAALVDEAGRVTAANAAFTHAALGDEDASLAEVAFASLLRSDEHEQIYFARAGRQGVPQVLMDVPLADLTANIPGQAGAAIGAVDGAALSLMLLFDRYAARGGWDAAGADPSPQLEALIERLPLGLAAANRDGRLLFANPAFRRAAGISGVSLASPGAAPADAPEALGERAAMPPYPSDLVVRADKTTLADAVRRYAHGSAMGGDITVRLAANPDEPASIGLTGVRGLGEIAVMLSLADTSEENRLKRQVAQATKMQAVGQLAGGVAHDFNNVLSVIISTCDLLLLRHAPGDADYDDIQQIRANSNRAANLTRQLLAFSRQQTLKPEIIQLPDVLSEVTHLLKRLLGARIAMKVHHDRDLGPLRADPRQLEQVIMNLAVNARDAIQAHGEGEQASGTLSFTTRAMDAGAIRELESEIIPPGNYTLLKVEDTGGGIPGRIIAKVFEPFFTTKEQGKGTGLGLSTVYGIVKQSGGFIFAENAKNSDGTIRGARFTIYLPVHAATPEELRQAALVNREPAMRSARDWAGGGHILVVEDEDMVRAVAIRALTRGGYDVISARDGEEGLAAFRAASASGKPFDLVLSDVVMPGMDGPALARAIRAEVPNVPVVFMSGYAESQLRDAIDLEAVYFLAKPFSIDQIADKVSKAISERSR